MVSGPMVHLTGAGFCTLTASQEGDANFNTAPKVERTFLIAKGNAAMVISSSGNPGGFKQSITLTIVVGSSSSAAGSGTVLFKEHGKKLGLVTLNSEGVGTLTIPKLSPGSNTITVEYSGDVNYLAGKSSFEQVIVK